MGYFSKTKDYVLSSFTIEKKSFGSIKVALLLTRKREK